jgi:hypothetical protein
MFTLRPYGAFIPNVDCHPITFRSSERRIKSKEQKTSHAQRTTQNKYKELRTKN